MKHKKKLLSAVASMACMSVLLLSGCGTDPSDGAALSESGTLILSVNPEIEITYDSEGKVTAFTGVNEDGEGIVASYPDYVGKECDVVLQDLIIEINEAGYFTEEVDGHKKNIVLQLEPGSILPEDDFLANMSASTQQAVSDLSLGSQILMIDDDDYDPAYAKDGSPSPYITLAKAQEIALAQANVSAADAVFEDKEFDHDDGTPVFELEFTANGVEYEYDVHAVSGKVIQAQHKAVSSGSKKPASSGQTNSGSSQQASNYDDTDYGPNNDGVTDYNDTDYGPNNDGVTDYDDTDYGPNNDGVTDYNDTDYGPNNDGVTDYNDSAYGDSSQDSNYDDGGSNYDDGGSDYD